MSQIYGQFRLLGRAAALAPALLIGLPAQWFARKCAAPDPLPLWFHRYLCRVLGLRIRHAGRLPDGPVLIVANHVSWLDIPVLGAMRPLSFIAKAEVADWPLAGLLARMQDTIFIDRTRRHAAGSAAAVTAAHLAAGRTVTLFAEGTTSDGWRVLPFRSALLGAAESLEGRDPVPVVPVAIQYRRRDGMPVTRREMPEIAWYGDMELLPHLAQLLRSGPIDVTLMLGLPVILTDEMDRKKMTSLLRAWIRTARANPETRFSELGI